MNNQFNNTVPCYCYCCRSVGYVKGPSSSSSAVVVVEAVFLYGMRMRLEPMLKLTKIILYYDYSHKAENSLCCCCFAGGQVNSIYSDTTLSNKTNSTQSTNIQLLFRCGCLLLLLLLLLLGLKDNIVIESAC